MVKICVFSAKRKFCTSLPEDTSEIVLTAKWNFHMLSLFRRIIYFAKLT
jgi:hypothetical protein